MFRSQTACAPSPGILLVLFALVASGLAACAQQSRPHVVMIIIDTLRADKLGCYGFKRATSPELDAFAARGVRFERVVAQSSWTRPSIGSLLTSRYPRTLGLYKQRGDALAERFKTLAEVLRSSGYQTLGITANPNINSGFNFHQGFDRYVDSTVRFSWMRGEPDKPTVGEVGLTPARELFKQALEMTSEPGDGRRWYVQIDVMDVHEHMRDKNSLVRDELRRLFPRVDDRGYLQSVRQVSSDIGEFIRDWLAVPGRDDTLFILLSDHGEGLGDHPNVSRSEEHGRVLYESNLWVPLVLYHPGSGLVPRTVPHDVRLLDLMPTVLDYLDLPLPVGAQGISLMPWVMGAERELALPEYFVAETQFGRNDKIAVRSRLWKYVENRLPHRGLGRFELQQLSRWEDGRWSDRLRGRGEIARPMREFLADWERRFPKRPPTAPPEQVPRETSEQLKALGYLD